MQLTIDFERAHANGETNSRLLYSYWVVFICTLSVLGFRLGYLPIAAIVAGGS
ncbi:MAG: hypothetical protein IJ733_20245 [Lachnospiraceae bacterium]|nr:hypothetical protein [Lachnospiraceae bacterium]